MSRPELYLPPQVSQVQSLPGIYKLFERLLHKLLLGFLR
jgi:hypothetical protein